MFAAKETFLFFIVSGLFLVQVVLGQFIQLERSILSLILIITAVVINQKLSTPISVLKTKCQENKAKSFYLWGVKLIETEHQGKEEILLNNLKLTIRAKKLFFSVLMLFFFFFIKFYAYKNLFPVSVLSFSIIAIVNSSYLGHYLFIFTINSIYFFASFGFEKTMNPIVLGLFTILNVIVFYCFYYLENRKEIKVEKIFNRYSLKVLKTSCFLFVLFGLFSLILPEKISFYNKKKIVEKIVKTKKHRKLSLKLPSISEMNIKEDLLNIENNLDSTLDQLDKFEKLLSQIPNVSPEMTVNLKDIKLDITNTKGELRQLRGSGKISLEDSQKIWKKMNSLKNKMKNMNLRFEEYREDLDDSVRSFPSQTNSELLEKIKHNKITENLLDIKHQEEILEKSNVKLSEKIQKTKAKEEENDTKLKEHKAINKLKRKEKNKWNKLLSHLETFGKAAAVFLVIYIIQLFFNKTKLNDDDIIDEGVVKGLKQDFKKIQALKLSPNEEIIKSYNVFKDVIKVVKYDADEVPPPKVLFKEITTRSKRIETETWIITDLFCDCYYGRREADITELKEYRSSFVKVLKSIS